MSETSSKSEMHRRSFLGRVLGLGAVVVGSVAGVAGAFLSNSLRREVSSARVRVAALDSVEDTFKKFRVLTTTQDAWVETQKKHIVFLRRDGDSIVAFDGKCTHLGCSVAWQGGQNRFFCPCHDGVFDPDGRVVSGPPPEGLGRLEAHVADGVVYVDLPEVS